VAINKILKLCVAVAAASTLTACIDWSDENTPLPPGDVKNVIMMIGDGMGPQQVGMLQEYAKRAPNSIYQGKATALEKFSYKGVVGLSSTGPEASIVVDSACSASQLATGVSSGSEMIGLDYVGNPVETILEKAKKMGKATGLISDTRITHATPASFAAHQAHRSMENEIASDMLANSVDVMLSGGLRYWIPASVNSDAEVNQEVADLVNEPSIRIKSKRGDDRNLLTEAQSDGYQLAFNLDQMNSANGDKLLGLFHYSAMMDGIAYTASKDDETRTQPTLKEMTIKALDILAQDPDGFFLMIEGGQIDWAAHYNDAGTMLHELLKFDESIEAVYEWVQGRNDTLVVITADHETGGFGFSYSRKDIPEATSLEGEAFSDVDYQPNYNFGPLEILDKLYAQSMSFENMWYEAGGDLYQTRPTAADIMAVVNANSEFDITLEQAEEIVAREENKYQDTEHQYLYDPEYPNFEDFEEFYVYGEYDHLDLIGRKVAADQNIVWGTGTHTHTPVAVIAYGPVNVVKNYSNLMHHTDVGKLTIQALEKKL